MPTSGDDADGRRSKRVGARDETPQVSFLSLFLFYNILMSTTEKVYTYECRQEPR